MTDYAAGQPTPGLPPFVEARAFSMAHIAMLDALRAAGGAHLAPEHLSQAAGRIERTWGIAERKPYDFPTLEKQKGRRTA